MDYSIDKSDFLLNYLIEGCGNDELELYKNLDVSNEEYGKNFEKIRKRILKGKRIKTKKEKTVFLVKRISLILLLCFSLAFVTLMSVSATRKAIWNVVFDWYKTHFSVEFDSTSDSTENEPLTEIKEINKPTNLPNGIEEEIVIDFPLIFMCEYYREDDYVGNFQQKIIEEINIFTIDAENISIYNTNIGKHYVTVVESEAEISIFWMDNHYYYIISGTDMSFLEELVKNVK
ncbi:MAG: DUF4367 domain-containing protein [Clostridia bacterium]|nr:DUF4367 domain-containing protein [Clostridia bacterium]